MNYEQMRAEVGTGQCTSWKIGGIAFVIDTIRGDTRHYVDGKTRDEAFFRDALAQVQPPPCGPLTVDRQGAIDATRARLARLRDLALSAVETDDYCKWTAKASECATLLTKLEMGE